MSTLRELVEQATQRQFDEHTRTHVLYAPSADLPSCFKGFDNEADAILDALAPELALLACDMAAALEFIYGGGYYVGRIDALLARFRELEGRTEKGTA